LGVTGAGERILVTLGIRQAAGPEPQPGALPTIAASAAGTVGTSHLRLFSMGNGLAFPAPPSSDSPPFPGDDAISPSATAISIRHPHFDRAQTCRSARPRRNSAKELARIDLQ
jgi:hypothetical protein